MTSLRKGSGTRCLQQAVAEVASFIATAAFGTPFAEEINVLRNWRDDYLLKNRLGTIFVHSYYRLSPPLADNIRRSDTKRSWTRKLLAPFIKILKNRYN